MLFFKPLFTLFMIFLSFYLWHQLFDMRQGYFMNKRIKRTKIKIFSLIFGTLIWLLGFSYFFISVNHIVLTIIYAHYYFKLM